MQQDSDVVEIDEIPIDELSDELLELFFQQNPQWVITNRKDWVALHHPHFIQ